MDNGSELLRKGAAGQAARRPWREASALLLLLMDASWLAAWSLHLLPRAREPGIFQAFGLVFGLLAAIYAAARISLLRATPAFWRRIGLLALLPLGFLLALKLLQYPGEALTWTDMLVHMQGAFADPDRYLPPDLLVFMLAAFVWLRGVGIAGLWIGPKVVLRHFQWGTVMLLLLGAVTAIAFAEPWAPAAVLFLFSGLMALMTARASILGYLRGGSQLAFRLAWILGPALAAAGLVEGAGALGNLASGVLAGPVALAFILLIRILAYLSLLFIAPLVLLVALLVPWIELRLADLPFFQFLGETLARLIQVFRSVLDMLGNLLERSWRWFPGLLRWKPYLLWGIMAAIGVALASYLWSQRRQKERAPIRRQEERLQGERCGRSWLRLSLALGASRLREGWEAVQRRRGLLAALHIRVLYARLMRLCEQLGQPRLPMETPLEFLPKLETLFQAHESQAHLITRAYVRVRYGEYPETLEEVREVQQAWGVLKREGRRLRRELGKRRVTMPS